MKQRPLKHKALCLALAAVGSLIGESALAQTSYSFSGFGTLGLTHSNNRDMDFVGSIFHPNGAGMSKATSFGVDSKAGVQGTARIGKDFTATVQVIADHRFNNSYAPRFEWANLKYQVNKDFQIRAGRVVAPVFMVSDYRSVGYAQTMARMPYDVYSQNPITHLDGLDLGYQMEVAGGTLNIQALAGRIKDFTPTAEVNGHGKLLGLSYEKGSSTFRVGYLKDRVDAIGDSMAQVDILNNVIGQVGHLVGRSGPVLQHYGIEMGLLDLGYAYDDGRWLAQSEFVRSRGGNRTVEDTNSWYVMGGYRIGAFTPYVSFSRLRSKEPPMPAPAVAAIPAVQPLADAVNMVEASLKPTWEQKTISLGLRYNLAKNLALKMQYDRIHKPGSPAAPNQGMFMMPGSFNATASTYAPAMIQDLKVNLLTLNLDFVF